MEPRQKAQIRAEQLMRRLHKFALGKTHQGKRISMDQAQVTAAKVLIDKGAPSLQAIEQTTINEWDRLSEQEVLDMAKALILQHPEVIQALNLVPAPSVVATETDTSLATGTEGPLQP